MPNPANFTATDTSTVIVKKERNNFLEKYCTFTIWGSPRLKNILFKNTFLFKFTGVVYYTYILNDLKLFLLNKKCPWPLAIGHEGGKESGQKEKSEKLLIRPCTYMSSLYWRAGLLHTVHSALISPTSAS